MKERCRNMRRKDREIPREDALRAADKCPYAVLCLIGPDGGPYGVPVNLARDGEIVYFHSAMKGTKTDCMRRDSRVCLTCVGDMRIAGEEYTTKYESAILKGRASEVTDKEEKVRALRTLCEKYAPEHMDKFQETVEKSLGGTAVWRVDISEVTGKRNK